MNLQRKTSLNGNPLSGPPQVPEALAQRLKAAAGPPPAFSPLLHQRVLAALRAQTPADPGLIHETHHHPLVAARQLIFRIALPLAVAAAAGFAAWTILQPPATPSPNHPTQFVVGPGAKPEAPGFNPGPAFDTVTQALGSPAVLEISDAKFGYIDKDAQRLALFVADQIPSLPTPTPANKP